MGCNSYTVLTHSIRASLNSMAGKQNAPNPSVAGLDNEVDFR